MTANALYTVASMSDMGNSSLPRRSGGENESDLKFLLQDLLFLTLHIQKSHFSNVFSLGYQPD